MYMNVLNLWKTGKLLAQKMTKSSGKKVVPETCSDDRKWSEMPRKHIPILGDILILVP